AEYLTQQGLTIRETQNSDILYDITTIHLYNGTPYTIQYLSELMNIPENRIFNRYDPASDIDIAISLGSDWALNNPMP
ncbi:MAG: LytR C-terminal domain-containing protein, partial [Anaerolineaceae bacterium]|nr:LytR C-terminal domain-containing protein [Anaerolineaceae bacterium]